jgi:hypothetical protein
VNPTQQSFGTSLAWTIVLAVVLGGGGYLVGLPWPLAALLAAITGIAGAALSIGGTVRDDRLPDPQVDLRHGARREIKQLSWNIGGERNRVDEPAVRRLRGIAAVRLTARGIDLDDPRDRPQAEALLGRSVYRVLVDPSRQSAGVLLRCVAALDRLAERPADAWTTARRTDAPVPVPASVPVPGRTT